MQFSAWNSYSSTVRTYALSTADLDMARWWARMETILPYRRKRAIGQGALARHYATHLPHYAWLGMCRIYVEGRKRAPHATGRALALLKRASSGRRRREDALASAAAAEPRRSIRT
jgi:hypothetical protein